MITVPIVAGFLVTLVHINTLALLNSFTEFVGLILIFMLRFKPANAVSKSKNLQRGWQKVLNMSLKIGTCRHSF